MNNSNRFLLVLSFIGMFCIAGAAAAANTNSLSMSDKRFVNSAAEAGHFEIAGSNQALKKSKDAEILAFAKMMVDDHTQAGAKLQTLASQKGVELPANPSLVQQGKLKYLDMKDGASFDKAYASTVGIAGHEAALKLFEDAAENAEDPDLKKFAADTLPTLKHHLEEAKKIDAKVNK